MCGCACILDVGTFLLCSRIMKDVCVSRSSPRTVGSCVCLVMETICVLEDQKQNHNPSAKCCGWRRKAQALKMRGDSLRGDIFQSSMWEKNGGSDHHCGSASFRERGVHLFKALMNKIILAFLFCLHLLSFLSSDLSFLWKS